MVSNKSNKTGTSTGRGYVVKRTHGTRGNLLLVPGIQLTFTSTTATGKTSTSSRLIPSTITMKETPKPKSPSIIPPQETVSFNSEEAPTQDPREYKYRKTKEVENWEALRPVMLQCSIEQHALYSETCANCKLPDCAEYRCQDCLPIVLCRTCVIALHKCTCLHVIEKWIPKLGTFCEVDFPELKTLYVPEEKLPHMILSQKSMKLIDEKGRTHYDCIVIYGECSGDSLPLALLKLGFWPTTPDRPNIAVSTKLLNLLHCLTLECHTSCTGFTMAVDKANYNRGLERQSKLSSIGRGECLPEFRLYCNTLKTAPLSLKEGLQSWITACPACPKNNENDGIIVSMDANFGLVHKRNSGKSYNTSSPLDGRFFLPQDDVDKFVDSYYQDQKDNSEQCSQFQAADAIRSKNKAPNLTVTGVFGCSCRHEIPLVFMDVRHGERLAYSVLTLMKLKETNVHFKAMYDIACVLNSHLKKRKNSELLNNVKLAIPTFHAYGHKGLCNVTMNPRRMVGFGLSDGEQMERLWSYLRPMSKISKEQTPGHRKELLTLALQNFAERKMQSIEVTLLQKLTKAKDGKTTSEKGLQEELASIHETDDQNGFIQQLKDEEELQFQRSASRVSLSFGTHWRTAYAKELLWFYTFQSQLNAGIIYADDTEKVLQATREIQLSSKKLAIYEKKHQLQRWAETSPDYQGELKMIDDMRRKGLLMKMQGLAAEKQFFIGLMGKYPDGQAVSSRLNTQLKNISSRIATTTKTYNIGGHSRQQSEYPSTVRNDEVSVGSELFHVLEEEGNTSDIPAQIRRKIIDLSNLVARCEEEQALVMFEMRNAYVHFSQLHIVVSEMIECLERRTLYEIGLYSIGVQFLGRILIHLNKMYSSFRPHIDIEQPPEIDPDLFSNVNKAEEGTESDVSTAGPSDDVDEDDGDSMEDEDDGDSMEDENNGDSIEDEEDGDYSLSGSVEIIFC